MDEVGPVDTNDPQGAARFDAVVARMPGLLEDLRSQPAMPAAHHPSVPQTAGIYLFSEDGVPKYVGQSRNLRRRLGDHTSPKSPQNKASFAFQIAENVAMTSGLVVMGNRDQRAADEELSKLFAAARARVAAMDVRFIELADPIERTIFEVFATLALGLEEFNDFETH